MLLCTFCLTVLYLLSGIAHHPKTTDNHCARHLGVLITEFWGRFGIPTLQGAALPPLCFVPQRHCAVHAQLLPQLLQRSQEIPQNTQIRSPRRNPDSGSSSWLWFQLWDTEAPSQGPSRECSCLPMSVPSRGSQAQEQERDQIPGRAAGPGCQMGTEGWISAVPGG